MMTINVKDRNRRGPHGPLVSKPMGLGDRMRRWRQSNDLSMRDVSDLMDSKVSAAWVRSVEQETYGRIGSLHLARLNRLLVSGDQEQETSPEDDRADQDLYDPEQETSRDPMAKNLEVLAEAYWRMPHSSRVLLRAVAEALADIGVERQQIADVKKIILNNGEGQAMAKNLEVLGE